MQRIAIWFVLTVSLATVSLVEAQRPTRVRSIGFVGDAPDYALNAFRQGLQDLGYVEGETIEIHYRYFYLRTANADLADTIADLVRRKVEIIVAVPTRTAVVARQVTKTIPIIFGAADPIGAGLVASLARPGGNATGVRTLTAELGGKRLELLKEVFPKLSRVAVVWNLPMGPGTEPQLRGMKTAAHSLEIQLQSIGIASYDFESAFSAMIEGRADAFTTVSGTGFDSRRTRITDLAGKHRIPAIYPDKTFVEEGGLMSYGRDRAEHYRRLAVYVDKVLKGAKPADLPVEQPTKFELVVNLKTAKQIGVTIPAGVLMEADRVIK